MTVYVLDPHAADLAAARTFFYAGAGRRGPADRGDD